MCFNFDRIRDYFVICLQCDMNPPHIVMAIFFFVLELLIVLEMFFVLFVQQNREVRIVKPVVGEFVYA